MDKNLKIGGILAIISGVIGILIAVIIFVNLQYAYFRGIVMTIGLVELIFGIISTIVGCLGYWKQNWGLTLAAAITGIVNFFPTAIIAIIFTALARKSINLLPNPQ